MDTLLEEYGPADIHLVHALSQLEESIIDFESISEMKALVVILDMMADEFYKPVQALDFSRFRQVRMHSEQAQVWLPMLINLAQSGRVHAREWERRSRDIEMRVTWAEIDRYHPQGF